MSKSSTNKKQTKVYTPEFRINAINLAKESGKSISEAAKNLGLPVTTLHASRTAKFLRPLYNERKTLTMATGLEKLAAKARSDTKMRFTSLAHHVTPALLQKHLNKMPASTAVGIDQQTKTAAKESTVTAS